MITRGRRACQISERLVAMKTLLAILMSLSLATAVIAADGKQHKVEIAGVKYNPAKLKVKKGETVVWVNADDRDHTVVARVPKDSKDKKDKPAFDSGKIAAGDRFEFKFDKTGKYEYGCEYHPRMKGVVEVTD
jgi:plastocyanin